MILTFNANGDPGAWLQRGGGIYSWCTPAVWRHVL